MNIPDIINNIELFSVIVFFIAFYGLITGKRIIKSVVSIVVMEISVVIFLLCIGYNPDAVPPIGGTPEQLAGAADPLGQALVITTIIIGAAVTAVNLTVLITICRKYKSTDWDKIKKESVE